jgi:16S rRNA C967 or C1407 C5-methylase (RsmB/RsmF family)
MQRSTLLRTSVAAKLRRELAPFVAAPPTSYSAANASSGESAADGAEPGGAADDTDFLAALLRCTAIPPRRSTVRVCPRDVGDESLPSFSDSPSAVGSASSGAASGLAGSAGKSSRKNDRLVEHARAALAAHLGDSVVVSVHDTIPHLLVVEFVRDVAAEDDAENARERALLPLRDAPECIVTDARAGEALMRGADLFAPGVLAATLGVREGSRVAVLADVGAFPSETPDAAAADAPPARRSLRGNKDPGALRAVTAISNRGEQISRQRVRSWYDQLLGAAPGEGHDPTDQMAFVGMGTARMDRTAMLSVDASGSAVQLDNSLALNDLSEVGDTASYSFFLQNEPSTVAALALDPQPGERVLDMCAAPGGKTTHLSQLMQHSGLVVAIDKTTRRATMIADLALRLGSAAVEACSLDSSLLPLSRPESRAKLKSCGSGRQFAEASRLLSEGGSFDRILLDAPCSGLGQRPRLREDMSLRDIESTTKHQRALFHAAVEMAKRGGSIVYSTCTLNPAECEAQVAWALATFPQLTLVALPPPFSELGRPGFYVPEEIASADHRASTHRLTESQADLCRRWDPREQDSIAFFVSKFEVAS